MEKPERGRATAPKPPVDTGDDDGDAGDPTSREVFSRYQCRSSASSFGLPHPGEVAEAASLRWV